MKNSPKHPVRKLYTSEMDLAPEHIDAFVQWYAFRHAPDIYQIGFDVCTSYRGVAGDMNILDLYEIDSVDIFDTPQYRVSRQSFFVGYRLYPWVDRPDVLPAAG